MSAPLKPYVVRQGDYLTKLAFVRGFEAVEVWNDARNEELRALRSNMDILAPGDLVYLPDPTNSPLSLEGGTTNDYAASVLAIDIRLRFQNGDGDVLSAEPYEITGLGGAEATESGTTDSEGKITLRVPVIIREISILFPKRNVLCSVLVGDMDPESEATGVSKRLQNLGHLIVQPGLEMDQDEAIRGALASFQRASGLDTTGELDDDTRKALVDTHGL